MDGRVCVCVCVSLFIIIIIIIVFVVSQKFFGGGLVYFRCALPPSLEPSQARGLAGC